MIPEGAYVNIYNLKAHVIQITPETRERVYSYLGMSHVKLTPIDAPEYAHHKTDWVFDPVVPLVTGASGRRHIPDGTVVAFIGPVGVVAQVQVRFFTEMGFRSLFFPPPGAPPLPPPDGTGSPFAVGDMVRVCYKAGVMRFMVTLLLSGWFRRRITGAAGVKTAKEVTAERGSVRGYETTFKINRHAALNNEHIGEALIAA